MTQTPVKTGSQRTAVCDKNQSQNRAIKNNSMWHKPKSNQAHKETRSGTNPSQNRAIKNISMWHKPQSKQANNEHQYVTQTPVKTGPQRTSVHDTNHRQNRPIKNISMCQQRTSVCDTNPSQNRATKNISMWHEPLSKQAHKQNVDYQQENVNVNSWIKSRLKECNPGLANVSPLRIMACGTTSTHDSR